MHKSGPLARSEKCDELCMHQIDIVRQSSREMFSNAIFFLMQFSIEQVDKIVEDPKKDQESGARICRTAGDAGCIFVFKYEYHRDGTGGDIKIFKILAEREKSCPVPINALGKCIINRWYYVSYRVN